MTATEPLDTRPGSWVARAPVRQVALAAAAVAVVLGTVLNLLPGPEWSKVGLLLVVQLTCTTTASRAALARRRVETGRGRLGWGLIGLGIGTVGLSNLGGVVVVWTSHDLTPVPALQALDGLGLLTFACGFVALCGGTSVTSRRLSLIDTAMATAACLFVVWETLVAPPDGHRLSEREQVLCAYLGGMALLLMLALLLAARWRGDGRTLGLVGLALGLELVAVVGVTVASVRGHAVELADPVYGMAFPLGTALLAAAGSQRPLTTASASLRRQWNLALGLPLASTAVVATCGAALTLLGRPLDTTAATLAITVGSLLFARQGLTLLENRRLTLGLEQLVTARTSELEESRRHYRDVVQHSSDVIAVLAATGEVTYCSPAVRGMLGHDAELFTGVRGASLVHPDDLRAVRALSLALDRGETGLVLACRLKHADGLWRSIEATFARSSVVGEEQTWVANLRDVTDRTQLEERLRYQAFHDPLTGLANRTLIQDRMRSALARARRTGESTALVFVDLDHFKRLNDTAGHTAGDEALVHVADVIRGCVRPQDTAARLGGDEFAVLLEGADAEHGQAVAARIVDALHQLPIPRQRAHVTGASVGICVVEAGQGDGEDLLRDADIAMYQAKSSGRGRAAVFVPTMREELVEELALESALRDALAAQALDLAFQPIIDLTTGAVAGLEALVRWKDVRGRAVPPSVFIPLAERTGLIGQLDRWVLAESCAFVAALGQRCPALALVTVNVNVSARDLGDIGAVEQWAVEALASSGLSPYRLVLEITETAVLPDPSGLVAPLQRLRRLGVRVSLDDFGTGYSSMTSLEQLPLDELKVDGSFVAGLQDGETSARVVEGIVAMAASLGLPVVAEAVETAEQARLLRRMACDYGQGRHFAPPMAAEALEAWGLARSARSVVA